VAGAVEYRVDLVMAGEVAVVAERVFNVESMSTVMDRRSRVDVAMMVVALFMLVLVVVGSRLSWTGHNGLMLL
jgi:hypothetical protein